MRDDESGFTIIELLTVVVILGVLAVIAVPTFLSQREHAQEAAAASDLRNLRIAQLAHLADTGGFAPTLGALTGSGFSPSSDVEGAVCLVGARFIAATRFVSGAQVLLFDSGVGVTDERPGTDVGAAMTAYDGACVPSTT